MLQSVDSNSAKKNIKISMTENGDPYENALAERVNGILKGEYQFSKALRPHTGNTHSQRIQGTG